MRIIITKKGHSVSKEKIEIFFENKLIIEDDHILEIDIPKKRRDFVPNLTVKAVNLGWWN